jgi:FkbM family methyltransferase
MLRRLYRGGNFMDIGSNIGMYVVSMAGDVRRGGGRIFSIEPLPANWTRQQVNIDLNRCADLVDYAGVALGATTGTLRMAGDFASSSINGVVTPDGSLEVRAMTLDQLVAERGWSGVGMIKIDVEGYEPEVLRGASALLERDRPVLFAEFNRERMAMNRFSMDDSWRLLVALGYRGYRIEGSDLVELAEPGAHENMIFLPKGIRPELVRRRDEARKPTPGDVGPRRAPPAERMVVGRAIRCGPVPS